MIKVMVVDDHPLFRRGLKVLLQSDETISFIGEAENGQKAVDLVPSLQPDVILMDLYMECMDGIEATRRILKDHPGIGIIMLTISDTDEQVFAAIQAGVRGFILKDVQEDALVNAIHAVARGEALIDPSIAARVLKEFRRLNQNHLASLDLTPLELDILKLTGNGMENPDIARQLNISEKTVVNRLTVIYQKLGVTNRTQAALYALRAGISTLQTD